MHQRSIPALGFWLVWTTSSGCSTPADPATTAKDTDSDTHLPIEDTDIPESPPPLSLCERDRSDTYSDEAELYIASVSSDTPELWISIDESEPATPVVGLNRFRFELSWVSHVFHDTGSAAPLPAEYRVKEVRVRPEHEDGKKSTRYTSKENPGRQITTDYVDLFQTGRWCLDFKVEVTKTIDDTEGGTETYDHGTFQKNYCFCVAPFPIDSQQLPTDTPRLPTAVTN
jgi:hypothetical protein